MVIGIDKSIYKLLLNGTSQNDNDDSTNTIEDYMLKHQGDADASELWQNFSAIIEWVRGKFISYQNSLKGMDWGTIYKEYQLGQLDNNIIKNSASVINEKIAELVNDDESQLK